MRALSIRQPWAQLIPSAYSGQALRGVKTIEYRSRPTRIVSERFYIYAAGKPLRAGASRRVWSRDLAMPGGGDAPPARMLELAKLLILGDVPTGVIVGSAVIERVTPGDAGLFERHLGDVERIEALRKPTRHPQPVWFVPFRRRRFAQGFNSRRTA